MRSHPKASRLAIETIKSELEVSSDAAAEDGLAELRTIVVRKPHPSVERLRNMQRVMTIADPKAAEVNVSALLDDSFVKKADDLGIIDQAYARH